MQITKLKFVFSEKSMFIGMFIANDLGFIVAFIQVFRELSPSEVSGKREGN